MAHRGFKINSVLCLTADSNMLILVEAYSGLEFPLFEWYQLDVAFSADTDGSPHFHLDLSGSCSDSVCWQ